MEVQISNSYLQNFISKYSHQSETKVVKYLAILGLHFLEKNSKEDISLNELKAFAKSVMKPQIKQNEVDLRSIKEELLKLSKRVEGKLANSAPQQQEEGEKSKGSKKTVKQPINTNLSKNSSSSKKIDTPTFSQKPPSARKEIEKRGAELRVSQLENIQEKENRNNSRDQRLARQSPANRYIEWQEGSVGTTKDEYGLTPKPNEIVFTGLETRGSKNTVTRHHLDDSQFKETMKEEAIVSYSNKMKNETPKQQKIPTFQNSSSKKENKFASNSSFTDRKPQELRDGPLPAWNIEIRSPQAQISQAKSPQFSQTREYFPGEKHSYAFDINKEELSKTTAPSSATRASRRDERSGQRVQKREDSGIRNSQSSKALKPEKSLNASKSTTSSHVRNKSGYKNVDSKIKDEINYHKELSKQYKKLKQNMGNFDDIQEELLGSSTRRAFSKEPMTEDLDGFGESARYNTRQNTYNNTGGSGLKTSQNFVEKTPIQPAYGRANTKPETGAWRNEDAATNQYTYTEESKGGMLDIANNFLNSPLMQHLSNIDMRNLDTSMKDSIFNTNFKPTKTSDSLMFTGGLEYNKGATTTTLEGDDEAARLRQSGNGLGQSRNSKWDNADYQLEKNIKANASILKDSTNRRFRDNMTKEIQGTGNAYDKEGPNSLASSNFSNFLNDEMKGFYQKEPFDAKRAQVKFGNSENSSNMSFSMNGAAATTREKSAEKNYFRRGGFKEDNENKTSETFSFDNANVFKNERMSITHLMGN